MKFLYALLFVIVLSKSIIAQRSFTSPFETTTDQNGFLKNHGQVRDFNNKPIDFIYFKANLGGQQVFITDYGLSILFSRPKKIIREASFQLDSETITKITSEDSVSIVNWEMERIDIVLKDALILWKNIITTRNQKSPQFNFYFDVINAGEQKQYLQDEVLIKNVYPGIDWKLYIIEDNNKVANLKYDFIIHPGANIAQIQLRYSDNAKIKLIDDEVKATTRMGVVHEKKPYSYLTENNLEVKVKYGIKKNTIHFSTASYDESKTLVIDPSVFWMTYLSALNTVSGFQTIRGNDVETDAGGNIFVQLSAAGNMQFPTVNPGGGAYYQDYTASPDGSMVIIKFAPGGQMLWSTYFGNGVEGRLMTIDKFGNITAIGTQVNGTPSHPNLNPTIPLLDNGGFYTSVKKKYFITKFSNSGVLLWSSYFLNYGSEPMDMSYDVNGNVYVTGWSSASNFPVVDPGGGAYVVTNQVFGGSQVLFISQFDATNHLTWSTRIEGNNFDPYSRVCTDKVGNIYVGGQARSNNYPLVYAGGFFSSASHASVLSRFNPARQMTWSTYLPGPFAFADLTTDDSCNLYIVIDQRILKFDSATHLIYQKSVLTGQLYFWNKINYDPYHDQLQLLGVMNASYNGFPTINTACNGSFFNNGISPHLNNNATGPIFATMNHDGQFSYCSLVDWVYEYYSENEMTIDVFGDPIYLFGRQQNGYIVPNPQLTNPGNGAYFDNNCCYNAGNNKSALLLKLTSSVLLVTTQVTQPMGCNCDGSAIITPQCGAPPFSYLWSNGSTTSSVNNLCPGNYWVKVTDAGNLSKIVYINVPYPSGSVTSIIPVIIPENCNRSNGIITIQSVQGGTSPYSYSLDGITYNSSPQFTGLDSNNYIVRVKDANGCVFNDTVFVSRIAGPTAITYNIRKSSCIANDGQLVINNVTGGVGPYQYTLSGSGTNNTGIFINLASANYQLDVSDAAGCTLTRTIIIDKAIGATDVNYNIGDDHCSQGIGFLAVNSVTGGTAPYSYSIDSITFINGTINNLTSDSYFIYVKDNNGCVLKKGPINVRNNPGPGSINFNTKGAICGKLTGDIKVNSVQGGSPPYSYSIDGGTYITQDIFTGILPGIHDLYVKDAYNCIYTQSFQIDYKPIARINLTPVDTTVCYDEILSLNLTGDINQAQNINWNIPAQGISATVKAINEQKVFVSITDFDNCIIKDTCIIKVKPCNSPEKCLAIPNAFTPNNDGKNELLIPLTNGCRIESIDFRIYNRWGELVYQTNKQGTGWDGIYKGLSEPAGVYIYICNYITNDGVRRTQKGALTLIR